MNKTKQFVKEHHKTIITIGGTVLLAMTARALFKRELLHNLNRATAITVVQDLLDQPSYDIWAMVGTKCEQGMFDEITKVVSEYGKTINFELLD